MEDYKYSFHLDYRGKSTSVKNYLQATKEDIKTAKSGAKGVTALTIPGNALRRREPKRTGATTTCKTQHKITRQVEEDAHYVWVTWSV